MIANFAQASNLALHFTEVSGRTVSGKKSSAEMLAEKGKHKAAVEIQRSGQSNEETVGDIQNTTIAFAQKTFLSSIFLTKPSQLVFHNKTLLLIWGD